MQKYLKLFNFVFLVWILIFGFWIYASAQAHKDSIIINGDTVEYSTEKNEATAIGNIVINYKGAILTCDKLTINTLTKEGIAEGNAKLEDERGVITGSKITYNFNTKAGTIIDAGFRSNPYFGKAERIEKINDREFISLGGYMSTCNYDHPHYSIGSKKIDFFPKDKVEIKGAAVHLLGIPILYLPKFTHSLVEDRPKIMNIQVSPGMRKEWGPYLLTGWRYNLTENIMGRLYLDYRSKLGVSEGVGFNYRSPVGNGDFKFYYTQEHPQNHPVEGPDEFERYFARLRHKWDIDKRTNLTVEYYKIADQERRLPLYPGDLLKDYFYREYEKNSQPVSYALLYHNFSYSSLGLLLQRRTNHWYEQLNKTPELSYSLPSIRIGSTPFYFENNTTAANFDKKATTYPYTSDDVTVSRFDTSNTLSLPLKLFFVEFTPFVAGRETVYDKGAGGFSVPKRTIFSGGANLSTKIFRLFDVKSDFLGLDINGIRHIITPIVKYVYNHRPTISASKLQQIDAIDSLAASEYISLELSNKLQTKREGKAVDLANLRINTLYNLKTKDGPGSSFSDFYLDLELRPYAWLRIKSDASYGYKEKYFKEANVNLYATLGKERYLGVGHRYLRGGGKEMTSELAWRLNPKWKFKVYERYQFADSQSRGLMEQEYTLTRDLHCWETDISYNISKTDGHTLWFVFRLKAFPELEFGFQQSYHPDQSGSQSNP